MYLVNVMKSMVVAYIEENPVAVGQLVLSLALVITTGYYAYHTKQQADEMEKSREATSDQTEEMQKTREATTDQTQEMVKTREIDNQPVIRPSIKYWSPTNLAVVVQNTGNSPAHNVDSEMYFEDIDVEPNEFNTSILTTDEEFLISLPLPTEGTFVTGKSTIEDKIEEAGSDGILTVETECENPFGDEYEYNETIDALEFAKSDDRMIIADDKENIRKAVEGIESNLSDIEKSINQEYTDQESRNQIYKVVKKQIEDAGVINYDKLKSRVYIDYRTLDSILSRMQESGIIEIDDDIHILVSDDFDIEYVGE
jgi:transcription termination factor NusB